MAYRASTKSSGSPDTVTINVPTNSAGDYIVLAVEDFGAPGSLTWPSGFSTNSSVLNAAIIARQSGVAVAVKTSSGSEPSTYTITLGGGNGTTMKAVCATFSGRTTPTYTTTVAAGSSSTSPVNTTYTGYTAAAGDDNCLIILTVSNNAVTTFAQGTVPTNYTDVQDQQGTASAFFAGLLSIDYRNNLSAGATGNLTGQITGSGAEVCCILVKLPAAAGPTVTVVQEVTSQTVTNATDCTVTLNSVTQGNTIALLGSFWNSSAGGGSLSPPTATDTTSGAPLNALTTPSGQVVNSVSNVQSCIWYIPGANVAGGTHAIKVSYQPQGFNLTAVALTAVEISGLGSSSPADPAQTASANWSSGGALTASAGAVDNNTPAIMLTVITQHANPGVANAAFACSGYTDLFNDSVTTGGTSGMGAEQSYLVLSSNGTTPSAAFTWTDATTQGAQAVIGALSANNGAPNLLGQICL